MVKTKNLIIGGGFAGLYLAQLMDDVIIIEQSENVGGLLQGFQTPSGQFTFDVGGHVYTTKDAFLNPLLEGAGAKYHEQRKAFFDFRKKVGYPVQFYADELGIPVCPNPLPNYKGFGSMLRHEFGNEFYEKVLKPFNQRVWSTNPGLMAADWVVGRVPKMSEMTPNWGPNGSFYYARGSAILHQLLRLMMYAEVFTSTWVTDIDYTSKIAYVECDHNKSVYHGPIQYENLYDTTGLVLKKMRVYLPHNEVTTVGLGLKRKIYEDFHWWYNGTDNNSPIHRITLLSRYHNGMAPSGCDSLLIEIPHKAYNGFKGLTVNNEKVLAFAVVGLLREAGFDLINERDVEEMMVINSKGYPIPITGHRSKVAFARGEMLKHNIYLVGRWGAHGYYNLDHIMRDARYAKLASFGSSIKDYLWANYYYKEQRSS